MGADLITCIVAGPVKLKCSKAVRAKILARATLMVAAAAQAVKDPDFDWESDKFLKDTEPEEFEHFAGMQPEVVLEDLLQLWEGGSYRDVSSRVVTINGKKTAIVVAGGESWGDEPDGGGYAVLRDAIRLDMLKPLGIS